MEYSLSWRKIFLFPQQIHVIAAVKFTGWFFNIWQNCQIKEQQSALLEQGGQQILWEEDNATFSFFVLLKPGCITFGFLRAVKSFQAHSLLCHMDSDAGS